MDAFISLERKCFPIFFSEFTKSFYPDDPNVSQKLEMNRSIEPTLS